MSQPLPWGIQNPEVAMRLATHILKGESVMPWWRKDGHEEDEIMAEAADVILNNIGDADAVNRAKAIFGKDMREQWTVEELEQLVKDREWWKFGARRN